MDHRFWETLGYDPLKMPHLVAAWQELIHPDDLQVAIRNFELHKANPEHPYDQIVRYRHANGSTVWVRCRGLIIRDGQGKPIRMLGAHVDVTQAELAKQALEQANIELGERVRLRTRELENAYSRLAEVDLLHHVIDGEQALAFLRREGEYHAMVLPDFVLLDLNLPRKSGFEVLPELAQDPSLRQLEVAVLTTTAREVDVRNAAGEMNVHFVTNL